MAKLSKNKKLSETKHAAMEDVPNTIAVLALVAKNYTQLVHVVTKSCSPRHIGKVLKVYNIVLVMLPVLDSLDQTGKNKDYETVETTGIKIKSTQTLPPQLGKCRRQTHTHIHSHSPHSTFPKKPHEQWLLQQLQSQSAITALCKKTIHSTATKGRR